MNIKQFIKENLLTKNPNRLNGNLFKGDLEFSKKFWAKHPKEAEILKKTSLSCQGGKRNQHPYNEACYRIMNDIIDVVKCKCGNPVNYHTFATGYHEFCSVKCQGGGAFEEERHCNLCNKSYIAINGRQKYCSNDCRNAADENASLERNYSKYIKFPKKDVLELLKNSKTCAICNSSIFSSNETLEKGLWKHVDHCHKTGKIRGILCSTCNTGLGMFKDNIAFLNSAIQYLKHHEEIKK